MTGASITRLSRREFGTLACAAPIAARAASKEVPIGLLLFAVRDDLARDLPGTLRAVSKMGYQGVEFFGPYFGWSPGYAREVRAQLDDLNLPCLSTHNEAAAFTRDGLSRAIELNQILGSRNIVCVRGLAGPGRSNGFPGEGPGGWKQIGEKLSEASGRLKTLGMTCGFHNHAVEFQPINGIRPIDLLAADGELVFHLDVGPCRQSGTDPVAFIDQYPGRIQAVLCSDWPNDANGHPPLIGKGRAPWRHIFEAAERSGGVRFYLVQQEGSIEPPLEAVKKDLDYLREIRR